MDKKVIALTGGIGSGKSSAGRFFASKGLKVIDCDAISKDVSQRGEILAEIAKVFGERFVVDGRLDRRALAGEVFENKDKTNKLNDIFHGKILQVLTEELAKSKGVVFVEIPLLEQKFLHLFDEVWVFKASETSILQRVMERDGRTIQQIEDILSRQKDQVYPCDVVVVQNDGTLDDLYQKLTQMLNKY